MNDDLSVKINYLILASLLEAEKVFMVSKSNIEKVLQFNREDLSREIGNYISEQNLLEMQEDYLCVATVQLFLNRITGISEFLKFEDPEVILPGESSKHYHIIKKMVDDSLDNIIDNFGITYSWTL
jgi:hypothetical protein